MSALKKHLKKLCKKQAKKAVAEMTSPTKKNAKKKAKRLAKQTYKSLNKKLKHDTKKTVKHQIQLQLKQLISDKIGQNDPIYEISPKNLKPEVIETVDVTKPLKKKPCGGCPALKNGLCKCAIKAQQRSIAV